MRRKENWDIQVLQRVLILVEMGCVLVIVCFLEVVAFVPRWRGLSKHTDLLGNGMFAFIVFNFSAALLPELHAWRVLCCRISSFSGRRLLLSYYIEA
jgi:hypothetical protein